MRFRRRAAAGDPTEGEPEAEAGPEVPRTGPFDSGEVPEDEETIDLGSLRLLPVDDREVRLQVEEQSGEVQAVLVVGSDGALDIRAFAAPRGADLWAEFRPRITEETRRAGGEVEEREGRYGPELWCRRPAATPDGQQGVAPSRVVGVNGDRWLLRATFLGRPAVEPDAPGWDDTLARVVVHRGREAMPSGEALPLHLPAQARRAE